MIGVALDLGDSVVLDVGQYAALPETDLAERRNNTVALRSRIVTAGARPGPTTASSNPIPGRLPQHRLLRS